MADPAVVLDASALLALLHAEPGAERVAAVLPREIVSSVDLSEVGPEPGAPGLPTRGGVSSADAPTPPAV